MTDWLKKVMYFIKHLQLLFLAVIYIKDVHTSIHEDQLISDLFESYNAAARPVVNDSDTVDVIFGLTLSQIIDVHEKNQILIISAWTRQTWKNLLLTWDPDKYHGIEVINVNPKKVWRPDIVLYNNVDDDKTFGGNLDRLNTRVAIKYDGNASWLAPIILKSKCNIDVKYFPFDTQNCPLKFGSWTYDKGRLNLMEENETADIDKYSINSEWHLVSATAKRTVSSDYICCPGKLFPDVTFTITIARRSLFYLLNLIFPMTIIGMLTMLSFLLPAESGERISLAITLLLAITVFMLVVADIIPATSDVVPLVGIFFNASMVEMMIIIIVLCYIMRLYHKSSSDPPMSLWTRRIILDWLSYKVKIRHHHKKDIQKTEDRNIEGLATFRNTIHFNSENEVLNGNKVSKQNSLHAKWASNRSSLAYFQRANSKGSKMQNSDRVISTEAQIFLSKLDVVVQKLFSMDEEDAIKNEWRIVAMTIDRCLLGMFLVLYVITLLGCFLASPGYVS